jgi:hypothetical protein
VVTDVADCKSRFRRLSSKRVSLRAGAGFEVGAGRDVRAVCVGDVGAGKAEGVGVGANAVICLAGGVVLVELPEAGETTVPTEVVALVVVGELGEYEKVAGLAELGEAVGVGHNGCARDARSWRILVWASGDKLELASKSMWEWCVRSAS